MSGSRSQRFRQLWFLVTAALPLACALGSGGGKPDETLGCSGGYFDCDGVCADLLGDGLNCGTCGTPCGQDQVCSSGSCQDSCADPGRTQCDSSCVDTQSNPNHCGGCSLACGGDQTCQNGTCVGTTGTGGAETGAGGGAGTGGNSGSYSTDVVLQEGELGQCGVDGVVESTHSGFTGTGYLNTDNAVGAGIEWALDVGEAGTYSLTFAYANESGDRPADLLVGDAVVASGVSFASTSSWTTWSISSVDVVLPAGESRIILSATSAAGLANIDSLTVTGAAATALDCGGNTGTGGADGSGGSDSSGGSDGSGGTGGSDGSLADQYPCDGSTSGYNAVVTISGNNARATIQNALNGLTANRTTKQSVLVQGNGSIGRNERIEIPSYTILNVCGTINVTGNSGSGDQSPFYAQNRSHIDIPNATITGGPLYAMFFRVVSNLRLGKIDIRLSSGFGIRIDNAPGQANNWGRTNRVTDIRIDDVHVQGTSNHGVETYGVDRLTIGRVVARNTGYAGLLLNATVNAEVGLVDAEGAGTGTGYAAFRIANEAGRTGSSWPTGNIHVGELKARGGGRGFFCVSDSGGLTIDRVDIANTGNDSMLIENCHNTRLAAVSGTVSGGGGIWITYRPNEHTVSSNVTLQNLNVSGNTIGESRCGNNIVVCNISGNPTINVCSGTLRNSCP